MASFTSFPQLPFELRHQIWAYTIQPRTITAYAAAEAGEDLDLEHDHPDAEGKRYLVFAAQPPATVHVCRESRSQLLPLYSRVVTAKLTLINFDIDTISVSETCTPLLAQEPWCSHIKRLDVDVINAAWFLFRGFIPATSYLHYIEDDLVNLQHLVIRHIEPNIANKAAFERNSQWQWTSLLARYYHTCEPIRFQLTVTFPQLEDVEDLTASNYAKRCRDSRRTQHGSESDYYISDSDDDVEDPKRYYRWRHAGCKCPGKSRQQTLLQKYSSQAPGLFNL